MQEIAAAAKPRDIGVLDAPICRGRFAADAGTLVVHKLNHSNAAPFFAMAFEAPHG